MCAVAAMFHRCQWSESHNAINRNKYQKKCSATFLLKQKPMRHSSLHEMKYYVGGLVMKVRCALFSSNRILPVELEMLNARACCSKGCASLANSQILVFNFKRLLQKRRELRGRICGNSILYLKGIKEHQNLLTNNLESLDSVFCEDISTTRTHSTVTSTPSLHLIHWNQPIPSCSITRHCMMEGYREAKSKVTNGSS